MTHDDHFDPPEPPPDEAWWERSLFQNEKMVDKYMDVLQTEDDWTTYASSRDLYNKVHYGIEPGEPLPPGVSDEWPDDVDPFAEDDEADHESDDAIGKDRGIEDEDESPTWREMPVSPLDTLYAERDAGVDEDGIGPDASTDSPFDEGDPRELIIGGELLSDEDLAEYHRLYDEAFEFGVTVMKLADLPEESDGLRLAACKVAVNLTGGHALGYAEDSLCGNIVKCRWALAECDFCLDGLQFLVERGRSDLAPLLEPGRHVRQLVEERIAKLRTRVWW